MIKLYFPMTKIWTILKGSFRKLRWIPGAAAVVCGLLSAFVLGFGLSSVVETWVVVETVRNICHFAVNLYLNILIYFIFLYKHQKKINYRVLVKHIHVRLLLQMSHHIRYSYLSTLVSLYNTYQSFHTIHRVPVLRGNHPNTLCLHFGYLKYIKSQSLISYCI